MGTEPQQNPELAKLSLSSYLPSLGVLSGLVVVICAVLYILWPQLHPPATTTYSVGDVSVHHSFANNACTQCHTAPFQKISDTTCASCHTLTPHVSSDKSSFHAHQQREGACVDCHTEHKGEIILRENKQCTSCHAQLKQITHNEHLEDIASWKDHPEFRITPDHGTLRLNHAVHVRAGLQGDQGPETLQCSSCHRMDVRSEKMEPITYERNCARCHTLEFDERLSGERVPHGDVSKVFSYLQGAYARLALAGKAPLSKGDSDRLRASTALYPPAFVATSVDKEVRETEQLLFKKTGCVLCHQVTESENVQPNMSRFNVEKVSVNSTWMPKARFAHQAHQAVTCESCHGEVSQSKDSTDTLMPKKEQCVACHAQSSELSSCVTCHNYHDPIPLERSKQRPSKELLR